MNKLYKDKMGRYRTQSLFWEKRDEEMQPIWTLKEEDIVRNDITYPSLKKLYMAYDHVPGAEYDFAMEHFGSWDHWIYLCKNTTPLIKDMIQAWKDEVDIRLKAKGIKAIIMHSLDNDPKGLQAAKYLVEKGYAKRAGRPSKEEVERELKTDARAVKDRQADLERIGLKVVSK
jgi:hypothetical protein|tara:strand:+ start:1141 stop:1659 length:519 start_codon:yes stop_codon:yes gene_type:complete